MTFFENSRKDIMLILLVITAGVVVVFSAPPLIRVIQEYQYYRSVSVVKSDLTSEQKQEVEKEVADVKSALRSSNKEGEQNYQKQYEKLGGLYERLGYLGKAGDAYKRALKEGPRDTKIILDTARVYQQMKYFDVAESYYRNAIEKEPTRIETYQKLADMYFYDRKDYDKARATYLEGLLKSNNSLALMKLYANFLELAGNRHEAYLYWSAILEKEQNAGTQERLKRLEDARPEPAAPFRQ